MTVWYAGACSCIPDSHPHRITSTKCCINTAVSPPGMQDHMLLYTRQSSTQKNKYKVSHKHGSFSWWWAHNRPKHIKIDKYEHTKKTLSAKFFFLQDYTEVHGQLNIKNTFRLFVLLLSPTYLSACNNFSVRTLRAHWYISAGRSFDTDWANWIGMLNIIHSPCNRCAKLYLLPTVCASLHIQANY